MPEPVRTPDDKYCPVCNLKVRYAITGNSAYWVHIDTGQATYSGHDVNTYAPDRLLDFIPPSYDS